MIFTSVAMGIILSVSQEVYKEESDTDIESNHLEKSA